MDSLPSRSSSSSDPHDVGHDHSFPPMEPAHNSSSSSSSNPDPKKKKGKGKVILHFG